MVKEAAGQDFSLTTTNIIYFERYIIIAQQSC